LKATEHLGDEHRIRKAILAVAEEFDREQKKVNRQAEAYNARLKEAQRQSEDIANNIAQWVMTMVLLNGLKKLWGNATEYVHEYYDLLNEVRIVTGKTVEEADSLGKTYVQMADDMKVSSKEIATAAVEYWRQG